MSITVGPRSINLGPHQIRYILNQICYNGTWQALPSSHHDAIKSVWVGLVPRRIKVFVWLALMGKINTRNKLASLGIIPSENNLCPLWLLEPETSEHLLLHCVISSQILSCWTDLWQISWVFPLNLRDAFIQWHWPKKSTFFKKVWSAVFHHNVVFVEREKPTYLY